MNVDTVSSASARIRELNDRARHSFTGCAVVVTAAIAELDVQTKSAVLNRVRTFKEFNADNDPYHEHDMAFFDHDGERYFFKWDYYSLDMRTGSDDPTDVEKTQRVLTIGFASDY